MSKENFKKIISSPTSEHGKSEKERPQTSAGVKERTESDQKQPTSLSFSYLNNPQSKFGSQVPYTIRSDKDRLDSLTSDITNDNASYGILDKIILQYKCLKHDIDNDLPDTSVLKNYETKRVNGKQDAGTLAEKILLVSNEQNVPKESKSTISKVEGVLRDVIRQQVSNILPKHPNSDDYRKLANDDRRFRSILPLQVQPQEQKNCEFTNVDISKDMEIKKYSVTKQEEEKGTTDEAKQVSSNETEEREPRVNGPFVLTGNHLCTLSKSQNLFQIFSKNVMSITRSGQSLDADDTSTRSLKQDSLKLSDSAVLKGHSCIDSLKKVDSDSQIQSENKILKSNEKVYLKEGPTPMTSPLGNNTEQTNAMSSCSMPVASARDVKRNCDLKKETKLSSVSKKLSTMSTSRSKDARIGTSKGVSFVESRFHMAPKSSLRSNSSRIPLSHSSPGRVDPCAFSLPADSLIEPGSHLATKSSSRSNSSRIPLSHSSVGRVDPCAIAMPADSTDDLAMPADSIIGPGSHLDTVKSSLRSNSSTTPFSYSSVVRDDPCAFAMPADSTDDLAMPAGSIVDLTIPEDSIVDLELPSPMFTPRTCSLTIPVIATLLTSESVVASSGTMQKNCSIDNSQLQYPLSKTKISSDSRCIHPKPKSGSVDQCISMLPLLNTSVSNSDNILSMSNPSSPECVEAKAATMPEKSSHKSESLPPTKSSPRSVWVKVPLLSSPSASESIQTSPCATPEDLIVDLGLLIPLGNSTYCMNSSSKLPTSSSECEDSVPLAKSATRSIWLRVPLQSASSISDSEQASINASSEDKKDASESLLPNPHSTTSSDSTSIPQHSRLTLDNLDPSVKTIPHDAIDESRSQMPMPKAISGSNSSSIPLISTSEIVNRSVGMMSGDLVKELSSLSPQPKSKSKTAVLLTDAKGAPSTLADSMSTPIAAAQVNAQASSSVSSLPKELEDEEELKEGEEELFSHVYGEIEQVNSEIRQRNSSGLAMNEPKKDEAYPIFNEPNQNTNDSREDTVYKPLSTAKAKSEKLEENLNRKKRNERVEPEVAEGTTGPHSLENISPNMRLFFTPLMDDVTRDSAYLINENTKYEIFPLRMRDDDELPRIVIRQDAGERVDDEEQRDT